MRYNSAYENVDGHDVRQVHVAHYDQARTVFLRVHDFVARQGTQMNLRPSDARRIAAALTTYADDADREARRAAEEDPAF